MEDSNWDRVQDELKSLRAIYSNEDQLNFHNGLPSRDTTVRFSLELKSSGGRNPSLNTGFHQLIQIKPNLLSTQNLKAQWSRNPGKLKYKKNFPISWRQSLDEELLLSIANFWETKLAFNNKSSKATENTEFEVRSVKAKYDLNMFGIEVHTFDGHFSASKATCTLSIIGASGAKSVALNLPSSLNRGKTVSIEVILDAKLLPISHVVLANPSRDRWRPQWIRVRACDENTKIDSMQWVQKGRTQTAFVTAIYGSTC